MSILLKELIHSHTAEQLRDLANTREQLDKLVAQKAGLQQQLADTDGEIENLLKLFDAKTGGIASKEARPKKAVPKQTLERVLEGLLGGKKNGMAFQEILSTIQRKKLYKTKSKNFENVLRRTISTSKLIKRLDRGVYGL